MGTFFIRRFLKNMAGHRRPQVQLSRQVHRLLSCFLILSFAAVAFISGQSAVLARQGNSQAQPSAATPPAGNADKGKALFMKDGCYECHDQQGQGGAGTGPRLAPNPIAFSAFVRQCRQPVDAMPPYTSKVLSDAELADIYAYLKSIPQAKPATAIPLLQ